MRREDLDRSTSVFLSAPLPWSDAPERRNERFLLTTGPEPRPTR